MKLEAKDSFMGQTSPTVASSPLAVLIFGILAFDTGLLLNPNFPLSIHLLFCCSEQIPFLSHMGDMGEMRTLFSAEVCWSEILAPATDNASSSALSALIALFASNQSVVWRMFTKFSNHLDLCCLSRRAVTGVSASSS
jgi:hypothetical protein